MCMSEYSMCLAECSMCLAEYSMCLYFGQYCLYHNSIFFKVWTYTCDKQNIKITEIEQFTV